MNKKTLWLWAVIWGIKCSPIIAQTNISEQSFTVYGTCGMCQDRIEAAAMQIQGVETASWDLESMQLSVSIDESSFNADYLLTHIASIGHDNESYIATEEVYTALHHCCKYREETDTPKPVLQTIPDPFSREEKTCHDDNAIQGMIYERVGDQQEPLVGVNVYWLGQTAGTSTDLDGHFCLPPQEETSTLILSYVGYANDTIDMADQRMVSIILEEATLLDAVEVTQRRRGTEISFLDAVKTHNIGKKELLKAACCNLAESFETTPAVDVATTDGVTGTRQIQLLGLAGPNVQIMRENMPYIRGLNALHGLNHIPGSWIQSMQLNLGTGSVANGFESITGQINVEVKKPQTDEKTLLNLYANEGGRFEGNLITNKRLNESWSTSLLLHARSQRVRHDHNSDGFLDMPLGENFLVMNRWRFYSESGWMGQLGVKGIYSKHISGLEIYDPERTVAEQGRWGAQQESRRLEGWMKIGKAFPGNPNRSMGFQLSAVTHHQDAFFGMRRFDANQQSVYANYLYQDIIGSTKHKYRVGASYQFDAFDEFVIDQTYIRSEHVPGVYAEYTHTPNEKWTTVIGLRGDYHNNFGAFVTPRLNVRYAATPSTVIRVMAGRGQRTPSIFAENIGVFASNRVFNVLSEDPDKPYGLDAEVAWNFGINLTKEIQVLNRSMVFGADFYHTRFQNQIVVDYDQADRAIFFYSLDGESFSNSLQLQVDWEVIPKLDIRLAYRMNDVQVDYLNIGRLQKPLVARHRGFLNIGYEAPKQWFFDATLNIIGSKRIPIKEDNPHRFHVEPTSPVYSLVNTQISKKFGKTLRFALGAENLFNFHQHHAINDFGDPDSSYFDASLIWGPIFGRMAYLQMDWEF